MKPKLPPDITRAMHGKVVKQNFLTHPMGAASYRVGTALHRHNRQRQQEKEQADASQHGEGTSMNGMERGNF